MRALRVLLWSIAGLLLASAALVGGLWLWSGSDSSLQTSLEHVRRWLPANQTLEAEGVQGSLRDGGRMASLRWQMEGLKVEARDLQLDWNLKALLLERDLRLGTVRVAQLRIDDQRPSTAPQPPAHLLLPLKISGAFAIDTLDWIGPPAISASQLRGDYAFDGAQHVLHLKEARFASGQYALEARLQATTPMAVTAQLTGRIETQVPGSQRPLTVQAQAELNGALAGADAVLQLRAKLQPMQKAQGMQAQLQTRITPWQSQPWQQVQAQWQALDLSALWPQAPQTLLTGSGQLQAAGAGFRAQLQTRNAKPGPWNSGRLPIDALQATLRHAQSGWAIEQLQAEGAGGTATAQGQINAQGDWLGSASLKNLNPAAVHTRLAVDRVDGQLSAKQGSAGIAFNADLKGSAQDKTALLRLKQLKANGVWKAPMLQLDALRLETHDALLQGKLNWNTHKLAASGELALSLPGANARVNGALSTAQGQGQASAQIADAALAQRWLQRWPGVPQWPAVAGGKGDASIQWSGGWQSRGSGLTLQARASVPQLDGTASAPELPWRLRDAEFKLNGSLANANLQSTGSLDWGQVRYAWQTQAQGSYQAEQWRAQLQQLRLNLQHKLRPGQWTVQLADSVALQWKSQTLDISAGSALLGGPAPGNAKLLWQAARWAGRRWNTQGQLQGLPLAWLELLGQQQMANLGLRGDLVFDGQWDAQADQNLRLRASLQRRSGDLELSADEGNTSSLAAGLREASLVLEADGEQAAVHARWNSDNAGTVQADLRTRLSRANGWTWAPDAPLEGNITAQLPRVGVWSLLAPPGWRLRGTLDANATLSGTRAQPQWHGQLQAQDLGVRSIVDGIDFGQGVLRVTLDGQHLEITEFALRGAGGAGSLRISGKADWLPATAAGEGLGARLAMDMNGVAEALRIGTRPDQRLVVSGKLDASLRDARFLLRGALKADSALFILPDASAPTLGKDVVVRSPQTAPKRAAPTPAGGAPQRVVPDIQVTLDLGPDFQLQGQGLTTRLEGALELRSAANTSWQPRLFGTLHTALGTYKAYGQLLDIEEGTLRFNGPYDNPALDILAIRPNLQQRVGVQINGSAQSPAVRLISEPELPEAEKLSWLVLGRSSAEGGAETALLQQAALALMAGKNSGGGLAGALGLDEVSVKGAANSDSATGTNTGASLTLGKRLSRNFYLAYERSLAGTLGTFYIFYDLSRRFTLRAQTGEESAVDLIFTLRYD